MAELLISTLSLGKVFNILRPPVVSCAKYLLRPLPALILNNKWVLSNLDYSEALYPEILIKNICQTLLRNV